MVAPAGFWTLTKDGDARGFELYRRHYSAAKNPNPKQRQFVGPGEKMVLITPKGDALFAWRKFIDDSGQQGVNCAVFRNESPHLSSEMIREATRFAWERWPGARLYTYVSAEATKRRRGKKNPPGWCFLKAGWRACGKTRKGLVILEQTPEPSLPNRQVMNTAPTLPTPAEPVVRLCGDALDVLRGLPDGCVNCCVTSPPYYGLRDYGCAGQLGQERTPAEYVEKLVAIFREVRRVLAADGSLWLNLGDSYATKPMGTGSTHDPKYRGGRNRRGKDCEGNRRNNPADIGMKHKDLMGIPWTVAFALRADGWYLRQDIIWHKPNPMPESVSDRCTKAHEYLFLLTKSPRYYFDAAAIKEPCTESTIARVSQPNLANQKGSDRVPGKTNGPMKAVVAKANGGACFGKQSAREPGGKQSQRAYERPVYLTRNRRSVWTIPTQAYKGAHFATFPARLVEPCIRAGCPAGGKRCDCDEPIFTPTGTGAVPDPTQHTGRAGMNRPRREGEGARPITRREQRRHAAELKASPHRAAIEELCGGAFAHYVRTDRSGARPLPPDLLELLLARGWITRPEGPCGCAEAAPGIVLDPFAGSGTTLKVARDLGRLALGIELNPEYLRLIDGRLAGATPPPTPPKESAA